LKEFFRTVKTDGKTLFLYGAFAIPVFTYF